MHHGISGRFLMQIFRLHVTMLKNQGRGTSFDARMINSSEPRLGLSPDSPDPGKLLWWSGHFLRFFFVKEIFGLFELEKKVWRKKTACNMDLFASNKHKHHMLFFCSNDGHSGYFFWQSGWQHKLSIFPGGVSTSLNPNPRISTNGCILLKHVQISDMAIWPITLLASMGLVYLPTWMVDFLWQT